MASVNPHQYTASPRSTAPPRKRIYRRMGSWLLVLVGLIVIAVSTSCAGSSGGGTASNGRGSSAKGVGLNQPVRDGKFEFTVTALDCSKTTLGTDPVSTKAQGTFCLVSVTVKNTGNQAQILLDSSQYAYDAAGHKYSADSAAGIYLGDANTLFKQINPGNSVQGQIVYDVPVGTKLTKLELHDSPLSGGATVNLG